MSELLQKPRSSADFSRFGRLSLFDEGFPGSFPALNQIECAVVASPTKAANVSFVVTVRIQAFFSHPFTLEMVVSFVKHIQHYCTLQSLCK